MFKKFIITITLILCIFTISGCTKTIEEVDREVTTSELDVLLDLLNDPVYDETFMKYKVLNEFYSNTVISNSAFETYYLTLSDFNLSFLYKFNENNIIQIDRTNNQYSTFKENIEINSLHQFSKIVLDSFKDEFSYYSVSDFIPLAFELAMQESFNFKLNKSQFNKNIYILSATLSNLNLQSDLDLNLKQISPYYFEMCNKENIKVELSFQTSLDNSYLLSAFVFSINDILITELT